MSVVPIPCMIRGLCMVNACNQGSTCSKRRVPLTFPAVIVDRKNRTIYGEIYLNYAVDEMMAGHQTRLAQVPCFNPGCTHTILMTSNEKRDLLLSFDEKYDKTALPVCSAACQMELLEMYRKNPDLFQSKN